jgi:hypothetical protein
MMMMIMMMITMEIQDNATDSLQVSQRPLAAQRTTIEFKKKRLEGPVKTLSYAMKPKKTAWAALKAGDRAGKPAAGGFKPDGFFLTEFENMREVATSEEEVGDGDGGRDALDDEVAK